MDKLIIAIDNIIDIFNKSCLPLHHSSRELSLLEHQVIINIMELTLSLCDIQVELVNNKCQLMNVSSRISIIINNFTKNMNDTTIIETHSNKIDLIFDHINELIILMS